MDNFRALPYDLRERIMRTSILDARRAVNDIETRMQEESQYISQARLQLAATMNPFVNAVGNQQLRQDIVEAINRFNILTEERDIARNTLGNMRVISRVFSIPQQPPE